MRRQIVADDTYRIALADALLPLDDPAVLRQRAAEMLGRQLRVDNVHYTEVDLTAGIAHVRAGYSPEQPSFADSYPLREWGGELLERTVGRAVWLSAGAHAVIEAPLTRDGGWSGQLVVLQCHPRHWTPEEIALVEESLSSSCAN